MKSYKKLNESEFHRMISEATMGVVMRVLQEVAGPEAYNEDYPYDAPYDDNMDYDYVGQPDVNPSYDEDYEDYEDYPRYY